MKIHERKPLPDPVVASVPGAHGGALPASAATGSRDRVSVSETARELARLRTELGAVDVLRPERVTGLRAVMAKGNYSADFENVARKLLRELLGQLLS
jgi:flagellar biosynthesis anti-sigma factor FlgM